MESNVLDAIKKDKTKISKIGISKSDNKNDFKIYFNENKYKESIQFDADSVYKILIGSSENVDTLINKFKIVFKKYSHKTDKSLSNYILSLNKNKTKFDVKSIKKHEDDIKKLMQKMNEKEKEISDRYDMLKSNIEEYQTQKESMI